MPVYTPTITPSAVTALDFHAHVEAAQHGHHPLDPELMDASVGYFRSASLVQGLTSEST